jgi:hypothetical protein
MSRKDKEKRYQSAGELRSELESVEKGIPTIAPTVPERKPFTSKEITVQLSLKKFFIPALIAVAVVVIGFVLWSPWKHKESDPLSGDTPSVAVLPFFDLSPQQDQKYFCDGLAAELINKLANIENLKVPAQASSFSFKDKNLDVQEIG